VVLVHEPEDLCRRPGRPPAWASPGVLAGASVSLAACLSKVLGRLLSGGGTTRGGCVECAHALVF
jgi:hypothetical protein